jgi:hypothetical protein
MANVSAEAGPGSRYTRVKAILEAAAAGGASDYGGLERDEAWLNRQGIPN